MAKPKIEHRELQTRPRPADFSLGSVESRAAARALVQKLYDGPRAGDLLVDLTWLPISRANEIYRTVSEQRKTGDGSPQYIPGLPRIFVTWPAGFDPNSIAVTG